MSDCPEHVQLTGSARRSQGVPLKDILDEDFRANTAYELSALGRTPERGPLAPILEVLARDPSVYGVLVPRQDGGMGLKSVCQDTALLFLTLREPGKLPAYLSASSSKDLNETIAGLVLDGVLEIRADGRYVTGREAYEHLFTQRAAPEPRGLIEKLSMEAVQHAQLLGLDDVSKLSARLYFYNRLPAAPRWKRLLGDEGRIMQTLSFAPETALGSVLQRNFRSVHSPKEGWFMWRSRRGLPDRWQARVSYKLYVSPQMHCLSDGFAATVETMAALRAPVFKVGRDQYGLLRPDKIICYFASEEKMLEAATRIDRDLTGLSPHGVPFTAPVGESGLVSWGVDPPLSARALPWHEDSSWRLWVTNQLAIGLLAARGEDGVEPWRFALDRLRIKGVDTVTWEPDDALWQEEMLRSS